MDQGFEAARIRLAHLDDDARRQMGHANIARICGWTPLDA